jgi:hypothetical protein
MWEGDYTDEAELEDWAAAIDWHSTGFLRDSGGASTASSSCASHDDSADNRGRRTATFEVVPGKLTNNDPPNQPPRLVDGGACSHLFFEEMDGWLLLGLPEELQLEVLSMLSPRELATVGAVCRRLRGLVNGERSLRKSLVGLPERYLVFRPRIPLADLEQSPQPQPHQHLGSPPPFSFVLVLSFCVTPHFRSFFAFVLFRSFSCLASRGLRSVGLPARRGLPLCVARRRRRAGGQ